MGLSVRTLLVWLLVLAVPAQGAAAATMAFCGPNHHTSAAAAQGSKAEHEHHGSDAQAAHHHHSMAAKADTGVADMASPTLQAKAAHADKHKCSACASCCTVSAILSSVLAVPAPVVAPTVFCAVVTAVGAFATDGPDRPPRTVLA